MTLQQIRYAIAIASRGSMNEAAKELFVSQPSLSGAIKELEKELGFSIFDRNNKGIVVTKEGAEFLGYGRQVTEQFELLEDRYISQKPRKKRFHVSSQHYTFAVKAFAETVNQFGLSEYDFAFYETRTHEVMEDVKKFRSEIGILYMSDFNEKVIQKLLKENDLQYHELFPCHVYVYLWAENPLAKKQVITMKELEEYPCISFDQGENNSFYLAEEMLSTYDYKKIIKVNDRATILNMMVSLLGYTLCSGIICEELNGSEFTAVALDSDEVMRIGYVTRKNVVLSSLGETYVEELKKYREKVL